MISYGIQEDQVWWVLTTTVEDLIRGQPATWMTANSLLTAWLTSDINEAHRTLALLDRRGSGSRKLTIKELS